MPTVQQQLQKCLEDALAANQIALDEIPDSARQIVPCANPQFGDYQWNGALPLAKTLKQNPRALAQKVIDSLHVENISDAPEIAGPGFVNFKLKREFVESMVIQALNDERLGVPLTDSPRAIVVDFSSPNVAKPMHVGHIRSTVIGDAIARLLRFAGHDVTTDNHIGDWGTQFGKIIVGWKQHQDDADFQEELERDAIGLLERLYKEVNAQSEADETVAEQARRETFLLQSGGSKIRLSETEFTYFVAKMARVEDIASLSDEERNLAIWARIRLLSQKQFEEIYARLNISFDHELGESFYNDRLPLVVADLKAKGLARESQGAIVVAFESPLQLIETPLLIQKSDGSALYGTTDLATIAYRMETWRPDEIIYVVDARQSLHFQQLFACAKLWGYGDVKLHHVAFGKILGDDNKPIKTRSGESVKLKDLLDEAERRAQEVVKTKNPELDAERQGEIARVVGIGAIKYADLSPNRTSDYVFSWDKMLATQGNAAPYVQYAYVRARSISRRAQQDEDSNPTPALHLEHEAELELAKFILRFGLAIETALGDYRLNAMIDYLFELAQKFTAFYDACPVVKSEEPLRSSRLALCRLTAEVLKKGLSLLGIETMEAM